MLADFTRSLSQAQIRLIGETLDALQLEMLGDLCVNALTYGMFDPAYHRSFALLLRDDQLDTLRTYLTDSQIRQLVNPAGSLSQAS